MTAPIFINLTPDEDAQLQKLLSDPNTHPKVRRRALAVRLSAQHWSAPRIAQFLGCPHTTVLNDLKRWQKHRYSRGTTFHASGVGVYPAGFPGYTQMIKILYQTQAYRLLMRSALTSPPTPSP